MDGGRLSLNALDMALGHMSVPGRENTLVFKCLDSLLTELRV